MYVPPGDVCVLNPITQTKFMAKLAAEKEATLRLKGENGIMKKKFSRLSKSVPRRVVCLPDSPRFMLFALHAVTI